MSGPSIPWEMISPYEGQALTNHQQSLEELARRGGLDPAEALAVLSCLKWRDSPWSNPVVRNSPAPLEELERRRVEFEGPRERIAQLEAALRDKDLALAETGALVLNHEGHLARLDAELEKLTERFDDSEAENGNLGEECGRLEEQNERLLKYEAQCNVLSQKFCKHAISEGVPAAIAHIKDLESRNNAQAEEIVRSRKEITKFRDRDEELGEQVLMDWRGLRAKLAAAQEEAIQGRHAERWASAAMVYLAGKISTPEKISPEWIQEALKHAETLLTGLDGEACEQWRAAQAAFLAAASEEAVQAFADKVQKFCVERHGFGAVYEFVSDLMSGSLNPPAGIATSSPSRRRDP
jgi:uncharacterized coiled-coil protein SlyX